jgi:hypothetical protein
MEVLKVRKMAGQGNLKGLASVKIGNVVVHDFRIIQQPGQAAYCQPPQRQWVDAQGKVCYGGPIIELPADVKEKALSAALLSFESAEK